jgi:hypothetical protein
MPSALIEGIRRKLSLDSGDDAWGLDKELSPEVEDAPDSSAEEEAPQFVPRPTSHFMPSNPSDFYTTAVRAAMDHGGALAGRQIPLPWLRMILAGLEQRHIEQDAMWEGVSASPMFEQVPLPEVSS